LSENISFNFRKVEENDFLKDLKSQLLYTNLIERHVLLCSEWK